jgi:hypothetical protein
MKQFAIYYTKQQRADGSTFYQEKLGSDGIAYLDARLSLANRKRLAWDIGQKRKVIANLAGFRLARGNSLDSLFILTAEVQSL